MFTSLALRTKLAMVIAIPMAVLAAIAAFAFFQAKAEADAAARQVAQVEQALQIEDLAAVMRFELESTLDGAGVASDLADARAQTDAAYARVLGWMTGRDRQTLISGQKRLGQIREKFGAEPAAVWNQLEVELLGRTTEPPRTRWNSESFTRLIQDTVELDALRGDIYPDGDTALDIVILKNMSLWEDALQTEKNAFRLYLQSNIPDELEEKGLLGPGGASAAMQDQFVKLTSERRSDVAERLSRNSSTTALNSTRNLIRSGSSLARAGISLDRTIDAVDTQLALITAEHDALEVDIQANANGAADTARSQQRNVLIAGVALFLLVAVVAWFMSRSITGPIRALTRRSREIATEDLPATVQLFRSLGAEAEAVSLNPLEAQSKDELGELVEAFNDLHATAIDLASEQAASRRVASEMFVNLGHRNQRLLSLALEDMDELEREENDPGRLAKLFSVDQKITRMRRNAESLLVLAGTRTPRQWSQPAPIADVIRAAMAEVEDFERVVVKADDRVMIKGAVVADLTHLLAELIENALRFSPPNTTVEVGTRVAPHESLVYILDNGFGLSPEDRTEANDRISDAATSDETPSKRLGHYVVGRLGSRHGINVQLREESVSGGTVARVVLGAAVEGTADAVAVQPQAPSVIGDTEPNAEEAVEPHTDAATHVALVGETAAPQSAIEEHAVPAVLQNVSEPSMPAERVATSAPPALADARADDDMPATLAEALPEVNFETAADVAATPRRVPGQTMEPTLATPAPVAQRPAAAEVASAPAVRPHRVPAMQPVHTEDTKTQEPVAPQSPSAFDRPAPERAAPRQPTPATPAPSSTPSADLFPAAPQTATPRRVPGANIPAGLRSATPAPTPQAPQETVDPGVTRDAFAGFQRSASVNETATPTEQQDLTRREPQRQPLPAQDPQQARAEAQPAQAEAQPAQAEARPTPIQSQQVQSQPVQAPIQAATGPQVQPLPTHPQPAHRRIPGENLPTGLRRQPGAEASAEAATEIPDPGSVSVRDAFASFQKSSTETTDNDTTEDPS